MFLIEWQRAKNIVGVTPFVGTDYQRQFVCDDGLVSIPGPYSLMHHLPKKDCLLIGDVEPMLHLR